MAIAIWSLQCFVFGMTLTYASLESIKLYHLLICSLALDLQYCAFQRILKPALAICLIRKNIPVVHE